MKKGLKRFLLVILALFLTYQVYDFFCQRNREREIEQVIVAMQNSVDKLKSFVQENEDDLEYLVTKCTEEDMIFYSVSFEPTKSDGRKGIAVEQEVLSRKDRLITNIPNNMVLYYIHSGGIAFHNNDTISGTNLFVLISSPSFTHGSGGHVVGNIGTIELDHTWTINIVSYSHSYSDYVRACKVLERMKKQAG